MRSATQHNISEQGLNQSACSDSVLKDGGFYKFSSNAIKGTAKLQVSERKIVSHKVKLDHVRRMTVFMLWPLRAVVLLSVECSMSLGDVTKSEGSWREHAMHGNYVT
jgi:hypothetical protein